MEDAAQGAEAIHFGPKDRPLRRDVGRLGVLLGELLRELAPAGVFETVEARVSSTAQGGRSWARAGGREDADLERVLVQTVRGIARGLRNTG